jgi:ketosteroid isomerase-like protein
MSRENVELIRRGYDALWRGGNWKAAFAGLDPEVEWITHDAVTGGTGKGREAVTEFFRDWLDQWDEHDVQYELTDLGGDRVLVDCHLSARGKRSGAEVEAHVVQIWTVREGRVVRMELFTDREEGRRAAGAKG